MSGLITGAVQRMQVALFASAGAGLIGWVQVALGAVVRTIADKLIDQKSIFDFMTPAQIADVRNGTALLDLSVPMKKACDYVAAAILKPRMLFPAGVYRYSVSPNWAIQGAVFIPDGLVRLRYTGTGDAVLLDGGAAGGGAYNVTFGASSNKFIVEAPATAKNGVFVRAVHHGHIGVKVTGCGANYAGIRAEWCVCTDFYATVSANEEGWYATAKPKYGVYLDKRGAGETTSYCNFYMPVIEYPDTGIYLGATLGNSFFGGTAEGCAVLGVHASLEAAFDKFWGVDFEANGEDILCYGSRLDFIGCDTTTRVQIAPGATFNTIQGGTHLTIGIDAGSAETLLSGIFFNRASGGGTLTDNGENTKFRDVLDLQTRTTRHATLPAAAVVAVGASPFKYTNTTDRTQAVAVSGGTVSTIQYSRVGSSQIVIGSLGMWDVSPGDSLIVTYSVAPSMARYPRGS